jgi:hypothetical protein
MKIKLVLASLAVAGLAVSSAVAAPPEGKGKPRTGEGCKPKIAVVLKGTLVSASTNLLSMNVTGANRWGRAYIGTASVMLDTKTKVRGGGMKTVADLLADLKAGDRVLVQARVCKDDLKDPTAKPQLTASKVIGHPAKAENDEEDDD